MAVRTCRLWLFGGIGLAAALLSCATVCSHADEGDSWTNLNGHALKASPKSIRGQTVTFARGSSGKTVSYPLSLFMPSEQERLRCRLKDTTLPNGLKAGHDFAVRIITRSRLLRDRGGMPEKECRQAIASALSSFRTQAAPFIVQQQLSPERLELIVLEMVAEKAQSNS